MDVQCVEEEDQRGSLVKYHVASYRTEPDVSLDRYFVIEDATMCSRVLQRMDMGM